MLEDQGVGQDLAGLLGEGQFSPAAVSKKVFQIFMPLSVMSARAIMPPML